MTVEIRRRDFLKACGALALLPTSCRLPSTGGRSATLVNDVHSRLNPTYVRRVTSPRSSTELRRAIIQAGEKNQTVCVCGGRHAMGAQQFATDATLLDTRALNRILNFDPDAGTVWVEAGIQWPELVRFLLKSQRRRSPVWTIAQKQTGANCLCIGGALASNIHGRGLRMKPFIQDVESFALVNAEGELVTCSREENPDLFRLAIGGYGLLGPIYSVRLRLMRRLKLQRAVDVIHVRDLIAGFDERIRDGFLYGDFQFEIDPQSETYLQRGIFSCYKPVADDTPMTKRRRLARQTWMDLLYLAHADPGRAFDEYAKFYLSTHGQIYWSDLHQFSNYLDGYHQGLDHRLGGQGRATEVITELYVPRDRLARFMAETAQDFREHRVQMIYGTIRLIERDDESFLPWARRPYACIIFNLCTRHTPEGIAHSAAAFGRLIDRALGQDGSFYLTYHKFATRQQVDRCYPQFGEFLRLKLKYDPEERFQSDWYRRYRQAV
jgi:FAD/FMN-containing dehydrogenase